MRGSVFAGLSSLLLAGSALAEGGHFYAGIDLGAVLSSESEQTYIPGLGAGSTGHVTTGHELGFSASAVYGYDFGWVRAEIEAGYVSADVDEVTTDFPLPGSSSPADIGSFSAEGDVAAQTFMANLIFDVGVVSDFTFFVGGGAGVAQLDFSALARSSSGAFLDDDNDEWLFAWQAMAGVRKPLSEKIDIHVRYRYISVDETELIGFGGRVVYPGFTAHAVSAGITFNF